MTSEYIASIALIITAFGWLVTYLSQREQTRLVHNLKERLSEHDTRFSHLHKRRADAMDALYKTMDHLLRSLQASIRSGRFQGEATPEEQQAQAFNEFITLQELFYQNRLYFDKELCAHLERLLQKCLGIFSSVGIASTHRQFITESAATNTYNTLITSHKEIVNEATEIIITDLPKIQQLIEGRMRTELGILNLEKH